MSTKTIPSVTASNFQLDAYSSDAPSPFAPPDQPPPNPTLLPSPTPSLSPTPIPTPTALSLTQVPSTPLPHSAFRIPHSPKHSLLPTGALTLLLGEPGTGKSLLTLDLAARLSRGQPLPFKLTETRTLPHPATLSPCHPVTSLILSLEDAPATIQSRLLAAHADLLYANTLSDPVDLVPPYDGLPKSWLHLDEQRTTDCSLLTKLQEYLPLLDNFRLLKPLLQLAEQHHFAILGITPDAFQQSRRELAQRFLTTTLAQGPIASAQVLKQARSIGISQRTLERARDDLHIPVYHHGPTNQWRLALPTPASL